MVAPLLPSSHGDNRNRGAHRELDAEAAVDDKLREFSGYLLLRATHAAMVRYKAVFAAFGLRRTTFSCLSLIVDNPGIRQSQLSDSLAIERPNLVQIVDELEKKYLIIREIAESDRRAYALLPTAEGQTLLQKVLAAVRLLDQDMTRGLSKQQIADLKLALACIEKNAVDMADNDEF